MKSAIGEDCNRNRFHRMTLRTVQNLSSCFCDAYVAKKQSGLGVTKAIVPERFHDNRVRKRALLTLVIARYGDVPVT